MAVADKVWSIREFCEALYCALAPSDAFAHLTNGELRIDAYVVNHGREHPLHLEFTGVTSLAERPEDPASRPYEPGDRLEFSVVELEGEPGAWRLWLNPWYVHEIELRCSAIHLNGRPVAGRGRWLQDELPSA